MDLQKAYDNVEWSALKVILNELSFPRKFISWIMNTITIVPYRLMVNIVMEYLYKVLQKLINNLNFNSHSKCEKLGFINLSFVDNLLLLEIRDTTSIDLLMQAFKVLSNSTGQSVNPFNKIYYGNIDEQTNEAILRLTNFTPSIQVSWYAFN